MVENAGFGATWAAPIASLMMEKYLKDSVKRHDLEERMLKGYLLPLQNKDVENPGLKVKDNIPVKLKSKKDSSVALLNTKKKKK